MPYISDDGCPQVGVGGCHCNHHIEGSAPCCWCGALPSEGDDTEGDPWLVFVEDDP